MEIEGSEAITLSEPLAERSTWPKLGPPRTDAHVLKEGAIGGGTGLDYGCSDRAGSLRFGSNPWIRTIP